MTKEQKILFMFVLAVAASSSTYYVVQQKNAEASSVTENVTADNQKTTTTQKPASVSASETEEDGEDDDKKTTTTAASSPTPAPTPAPKTVPQATQTKTLKKSLVYNVPDHMQESIIVTLVVDATGKIADVTFAYNTPTNRESAEYLSRFNSAFSPSLVVGKKMSEVSLSRVGGASLTTGAFNKAVADLSTQL